MRVHTGTLPLLAVAIVLVACAPAEDRGETAAVEAATMEPGGQGQDSPSERAMHDVTAADLVYNDIEVPGFRTGMKLAPIHGDPSVADKSYTLRLWFPDGYQFPPHWHPRAENVTVLEGTLLLAMGEEFDESELKTYQPGDYLFIAGKNAHYGGTRGETVLQLHGIGPFDIVVVQGQEMAD